MELNSVLSKVRGLINKAEHPQTPPVEAQACREAADRLMLKYAIDQATLRESQPVAARVRPGKITVDVCEAGSPYEDYFTALVTVVCEHTRTSAVFFGAGLSESDVAYYSSLGRNIQVQAKVYGFEADLKYFEILYTTLLLHMSNGIDPSIDPSLSDDENAYNLHMAGLNWLEIAALYYKRGHEYGWNGDKSDYMKFGSYWKRGYRREARRRGEDHVILPAKFTDKNREIWRKNFARSYTTTIRERLWEVRESRPQNGELILRSAMDEIMDLIKEEHPRLNVREVKDDTPYHREAWQAGNRHAQLADLNHIPRAGSAARPGIG